MVLIPAREVGNFLGADRTDAILLLPKVEKVPPSFEGACHLHAETGLEVGLPCRVVRISLSFDLGVALNGYGVGVEELDALYFPFLAFEGAAKHPLSVADGLKVFILHPPPRLLRVSAPYPTPEGMV